MQHTHSLKAQLEGLIEADPQKWAYMQSSSPDGVWYRDLLQPQNEWTDPGSWEMVTAGAAPTRDAPVQTPDSPLQSGPEDAVAAAASQTTEVDFPYEQIVRYRHQGGSVVWAHCRVIAQRDEDDTSIRFVGPEENLPGSHTLPEPLPSHISEADDLNADLRSFAYSISHDMKAPANTLHMLLVELQQEGKDDLSKDAQGLLDLSLETVGRMQRLVDDVLDYTRVTGMKVPFVPVDLNTCAQNAVSNLRADIALRNAQITTAALPVISGVETQMTLLFQNLLSNAIKFCPEHVTPCIDVSCTPNPDNDTVDISVRDNGIGIPADEQSPIFEMFHRLHTHTAFAGTGLGLSLCQRIALNHRGEITVSSQDGEGATFTVTLPRSSH